MSLARLRGPVLASLVALAGVLFQYQRHRDETARFTRFELPAFDPYVYVAMAEQPRFFTVAPWGYRILTPWVIHTLPFRSAPRGYRMVTVASMTAAGLLLFLFLRRLGHGEWASLLAVAAFEVSGPVGECVESLFVTEPLTVALFVAFLLAASARAHVAVLALLAVLLAFSKELWILVLPLVYFVHRDAPDGGLGAQPRSGGSPQGSSGGIHSRRSPPEDERSRLRGLGAAVAVGLPALIASLGLRSWWVPHIQAPRAPLNLHSLQVALDALWANWGATWPALLLAGLTPLAVVGAILPRGRAFARRYGYLALATIGLALVAWINIPAPMAIPLYGSNTMRLMVYALPLLVPLALFAVDGLVRHWREPASPSPLPAPAVWAAAALTVAATAFPFVMLDRYRRLPLHHYRDGRLVLTLCRESLRTARRLESGREAAWELAKEPVPARKDDTPDMSRIRWYLREGWGMAAREGSGQAAMESPEATLLLPSFAASNIDVTLGVTASSATPVSLRVNGRPLGQSVIPGPEPLVFHVPATLLFRGDNLLTLSSAPGLRLTSLSYRPAP